VSKFKVDLGPGANKCPAINADIYPSGSIQTTMWSYYDDTHYANKNVTKDNNNKIIQYGLSNDNKYIEYIGGQYAVEITYDYPEYNNLDDPNEDLQPLPEIDESNPSSDLHNINSTDSVEPSEGSIGSSEGTEASVPPVDLDDVKTPGSFWFGENEQVIETKDEYGRQVYKVTYDSTYYCNAYSPQSISSANKMMVVSSPEKNDLTKTKVVLLVDKDTYEILQTKTYLGEIADDNLLTTESSSFEYSNPDFADVKSIFAYDLEIPLKQYSYKYYSINETNEMLKDLILNENLSLLLPTDKSYDSYSLYSPSIENQPNFQNYIYNRDYYPDTDYGEKLYNNIAAYAPSLINDSILLQSYYSYSGDTSVSMDNSMPVDNGYKSYSISILESNISNKAIIKDLYKDYNNNGDSNGTDINLQIDEKSVSAKLYSLSTTQPQVTSLNTSKEEIDNGSIPMETDNNSYLVIFDFDNNKYVIVNSDYGTAQQDKFINELKFTSLKSTNPAQKSEIEKLVDSSYPKY
ncbi:hypothetical protein KC660_03145, partial [Candidatus Dojkabacteria bacterium]|nr:hypothetical protein [Candidatus Dojkabacteria bacterium]